MGGINLMNLGGIGALLPSPAAGIPKPNMLAQLGQEATKVPLEVEQLAQQKNQTELQKTQVEDLKRKTVQDRYDRNIQLVKNNPALKNSSALVSAIDADAKSLGVVAPITQSQPNVAGSSTTANPMSPASATPAGGAAPAGNAPAQEGGMGAPLNMPATPAGAPAVQQQPPAGAPMGGGPGGAPAYTREIDLEAISPHPNFSQFVTQPNFTKEAYSLTPAQRASAYPPAMFSPHDQPPQSFYDAPKTWGPDDTAKAAQARQIVAATIKNGDPTSIIAAVDSIAPMYKDDPNYDISKLIDPAAWRQTNKLQKDRLDIMKRAGVISEKTLDLRTRKIDADIQMAHTRQGLLQYTAEQKRLQNIYLPAEKQAYIDNISNEITTRTKNAQTNSGRLQETIANNKVTSLGKDKADAIQARGQLSSSINNLQSQVRALVASGMDQTPATDDQGQPTTQGAKLGAQIVAAQDQLAKLDEQIKIVPAAKQKMIQSMLPNATKVTAEKPPFDVPAGYTAEKRDGKWGVTGSDGKWWPKN